MFCQCVCVCVCVCVRVRGVCVKSFCKKEIKSLKLS